MPKNILIVDDDRLSAELAKNLLQSKGYQAETAQDGQKALDTLKDKKPDLILLDVQMPEMDGYTFIMKKNQDPTTAGIPVIVLTSLEKTGPIFKRNGARAYLLKPLNTQELFNEVQAIVPL